MGLFRAGLPAAVRAALVLTGGERPIAWGRGPEGTYSVATDRALHLAVGTADAQRIPWDQVVRASWAEPVLDLVVQQAPGRRQEQRQLHLDEPGDLPVVVRERVTASIVVQEHLDLGDGRGARVVARRDADTGVLRWSVTFDAGSDPRDPALRAAADAALADLRAQLGV